NDSHTTNEISPALNFPHVAHATARSPPLVRWSHVHPPRSILLLRSKTSLPPRPFARRHQLSRRARHILFPAGLLPRNQHFRQPDSLDHQPIPSLIAPRFQSVASG